VDGLDRAYSQVHEKEKAMSTIAVTKNVQTGNTFRTLGLWALQIGAAAMFLMAGYAKLSGDPQMVGLFGAIGLGQWFRYLTGALEVIGAVTLLVPALAGAGALLLVGVMFGALATHFVIGGSPLMAIVLLVATAIVAYARRKEIAALIGR
jgi:hypothetical protein